MKGGAKAGEKRKKGFVVLGYSWWCWVWKAFNGKTEEGSDFRSLLEAGILVESTD